MCCKHVTYRRPTLLVNVMVAAFNPDYTGILYVGHFACSSSLLMYLFLTEMFRSDSGQVEERHANNFE